MDGLDGLEGWIDSKTDTKREKEKESESESE